LKLKWKVGFNTEFAEGTEKSTKEKKAREVKPR